MQPSLPLLVLKFGGAPLATRDGLTHAAGLVLERVAAGHCVCVVVSASGDTTDDFVRQAERCGIGADDRETDALMACGENVTAAQLAMHLRQRGQDARSLSGAQAGLLTDARHGDAAVLAVEPHRVRRLLQDGIVPVVAGFQGATVDSETTTLGRGGSDLTAVLLAASLGARGVELYKDVAGIYDRDPTEHRAATLHAALDYDQLAAIVRHGRHAVVQHKAIDAARAHGVPLHVLPFVGGGAGTVVSSATPRAEVAAPPNARTAVFDQVESAVRSYCRSFPTVFARAKGAHLFDEAGRSYIDFFAGAGALNYGHNPDFIRERLIEHLRSDAVTHALDMFTTTKRDFLEQFRSVVLEPRGLDYRVQFCGPTGANSVEAALKLARLAKRRVPVAAFSGGWHGMTAGCLSVTGNRDNRAGAGAPLPYTVTLPYPEGPYRLADALGYVNQLFDDPNSGLDTPAAVILETIQAEGGIYVAPVEWLRGIRELCDRHGVLMIVDEVQVGCGRAGTFFSFERAGIVPDLVCLSKSIGGYGLPMSLLLIKPQFDVWQPGQHSGTFRGNQLAFCAAKEALSLWRTPRFEAQIAERAAVVRETLERELCPLHPQIEIRGMGLIWGLDLARAGGPALAKRVAQRCFDHGLIIERCGRDDTVLKIMPPLVIGLDTLRQGLDILATATREAIAERAAPTRGALANAS